MREDSGKPAVKRREEKEMYLEGPGCAEGGPGVALLGCVPGEKSKESSSVIHRL